MDLELENARNFYKLDVLESPESILIDLRKSIFRSAPNSIIDTLTGKVYRFLRITKKWKVFLSPETKGAASSVVGIFDYYRSAMRKNNTCCYCGESKKSLEKDHILPKSSGYIMNPSNKAFVCVDCNRMKANQCLGRWLFLEKDFRRMTPEEWGKRFVCVSMLIENSGEFLHPEIVREWFSFFPS